MRGNIGQWIIAVYGTLTDSLQSLSTEAFLQNGVTLCAKLQLMFTQSQCGNNEC